MIANGDVSAGVEAGGDLVRERVLVLDGQVSCRCVFVAAAQQVPDSVHGGGDVRDGDYPVIDLCRASDYADRGSWGAGQCGGSRV